MKYVLYVLFENTEKGRVECKNHSVFCCWSSYMTAAVAEFVITSLQTSVAEIAVVIQI